MSSPVIPKTQKAIIFESNGGPLEYKDIPVPTPKSNEILVNIKYSGVCHTDLHAWKGDWPLDTKLPLVGGHEGAGIVVAIGDNVKGWKIGDYAGVKWLNGSCMAVSYTHLDVYKRQPYRSNSSIYKHMRRKYHIFQQRGKWTPEDEKKLAELCAEKEGQWSDIGKEMNRMPEDCRDRWRNYVKCGANRASNKWTSDEENQLRKIINEMVAEAQEKIRDEHIATEPKDKSPYIPRTENDKQNENQGDTDIEEKEGTDNADPKLSESLNPENIEIDAEISEQPMETATSTSVASLPKVNLKDVINWTVISERMGGTRSRIQCRYKWNKLMRREALYRIEFFTAGERDWLLRKIIELGYPDEKQINWDNLSEIVEASGSKTKWTPLELKLFFEKSKKPIKHHRDKTLTELCQEMIAYYDSQMSISV